MDPCDEGAPCFRLVRPRGRETPVVVEVPHAGLGVDPVSAAEMQMPARCLARDADLHVDALVADVSAEGATLLVANVSRFVVDLNRSEDDHDAFSVEGSDGDGAPHGVVWHRATLGERVLSAPVSRAELERRLESYHRPYHRALTALLAEKKQRFGYAILLSAHSMPSVGVGTGGRSSARADVVPGTRGRTSAAPDLIDHVEREARGQGLSVRHDDPYRGGFVTRHYGKPTRGVHAIQIEIARRLYMSEESLCTIARGVTTLRSFYRALARSIATVPLTTKSASVRSLRPLVPSKTSSPRLSTSKSAIMTPLSGIRARPPLLASDALREDVAPEHPATLPSRVVAGAAGAALAVVGAVLASGLAGPVPPLAPYGAFACAVLLGVLAANVPYRTRAYAMGVAGAVLLVEGLLARGPAYGLTAEAGTSITWEATRVLAATLLPAALFFRASYRAYPAARVLLAGALLLALPFVVRSAYVIALPSPFGARLTAGTTIGAVLLALVGFMGSGTTAMGSGWASLVLVTIAADVGIGRVLAGSTSPWPAHASTAIAFFAGASLAAVGLFQTAALHLAADARLIDVKRHEEPPDEDDDNTVA